jgi:outer membrane protein
MASGLQPLHPLMARPLPSPHRCCTSPKGATTAWAWSLAIGLWASTAGAQAQEAFAPVSLERALELASAYSPRVVQAAGAVEVAEASQRTAAGAYLPSLSVSGAASYASSERFNPQTNTVATGGNAALNAGVGAGWDVYTGGRRAADRRRARAQRDGAKAQLVDAQASLAYEVQSAFFAALRAKELEAAAASRVRRAEEGVAAADRRSTAGTATRSDVLRAQLELNSARQVLLEQRTQRRALAFALGRLVGFSGGADPSAEPSAALAAELPREEPFSTGEILARAPELRTLEAEVTAAGATESAARARFLPALRLSTGYDLYNQDLSTLTARSAWSARLGLSYPLFDGFARDEGVTRAQVQQRVARAQLEDTRRLLRAEAERAVARLHLTREKIALSVQALEVAQEDLRVQQERYRLGVSTMLDLLASQAGLVDAESGLITSRFDYQLARAELEALAGGAR